MAGTVAIYIFLIAILVVKVTLQSLQDDITSRMNDTEKSLSRKRRYLIFPEGSSLQLVFCLTIPSIGMGNIFTIGSTAALAWELPHDPFVPFRRPSELLHRIDKPGKHTSGGWKLQNAKSPAPVTYKKTYYNPFLINKPPAVGYTTINRFSQKPSVANQRVTTIHTKTKTNYYNGLGTTHGKNYNQYRTSQHTGGSAYKARNPSRKVYNEPVTTYINPIYHKIYRRTRRDLYSKIEKLFTGLSRDGRGCLLKAVCEVNRATREKGTFMEEIIKAIFRVRHHQDEGLEETDEYDLAANKQHNCTEMYPTCEHSIWNGMFSFS